MSAFWGLFLLLGYGCLGGLVITLRGWFGSEPLMEPLPVVGTIDLAKVLAIGTLAVGGFVIHRILNQPKLADLLIDTENELKKVTWPSAGETVNGTIAVIVTVAILVAFLSVSDLVLTAVLTRLMGVTG
jgi:preprotein translocase SecE subunit